jgi:hypothetical protein
MTTESKLQTRLDTIRMPLMWRIFAPSRRVLDSTAWHATALREAEAGDGSRSAGKIAGG